MTTNTNKAILNMLRNNNGNNNNSNDNKDNKMSMILEQIVSQVSKVLDALKILLGFDFILYPPLLSAAIPKLFSITLLALDN